MTLFDNVEAEEEKNIHKQFVDLHHSPSIFSLLRNSNIVDNNTTHYPELSFNSCSGGVN